MPQNHMSSSAKYLDALLSVCVQHVEDVKSEHCAGVIILHPYDGWTTGPDTLTLGDNPHTFIMDFSDTVSY